MADQPEKEVRFAVVMYGGVSLAIYINGVTQELMSMVRATAGSLEKDGAGYHLAEVKRVEAVYRRLGAHLKARFVVDILSGTSAGGINAVFLAKALANDQQIDQLKEMWIDQGDIGLLLNDKESVAQLDGLMVPDKPASLLNSERMYYQLLSALQGMKPKGASASGGASPYVEELDLFITATDLQGRALPIRSSAGQLPRERRFRNVFHFRYATPEAAGIDVSEEAKIVNDFEQKDDPFLAFAARCTSSFPFAFEPMRLQDIKRLLGNRPFNDYSYETDGWARFYRDYDAQSFPAQSFGDGGYLDNKPFSYATATLSRRRADLPVDRKLVYIEPAPERIQETPTGEPEPPDAIANVLLALLTLPRYETIREDLQAVTARNEVIQTVNDIVQNIDDVYTLHRKSLVDRKSSEAQKPVPVWRKQFLNDMIDTYGAGYLPYHQLRVREVLANLLELFLRRMGWKEDSPQASDLLSLLRAWQHAYYKTSSEEPDETAAITRKSENDLLFRLDTGWYIRRLHYLRGLIDTLVNDLASGKFNQPGSRSKSILDHSQGHWQVTESNKEDYRSALLWVKRNLNQAYVDLRGKGRSLRSRKPAQHPNHFRENRKEYDRHISELKTLLESKRQEGENAPTGLEELAQLAARKAANMELTPEDAAYYHEGLNHLEDLTTILTNPDHGLIYEILKNASEDVHKALKEQPAAGDESNLSEAVTSALKLVQNCLAFYEARFEYFDMLTFPITYGTNVGESDIVEIIRISPEDAVGIVDKENSHTKLAGTKLGNFGAFFNPQWRENDMLWGRLDGAECLIKAVWPGEQDTARRDEFISEAHQAILEDFLLSKDQLTTFQARYGLSPVSAEELQQAVARLTEDKDRLIENFKRTYRVDRDFPPEPTLRMMSRASSVLGQLMGSLTDKYPLLNQPAGIFSRFGKIFFTLVSVAIPESLSNLIFRTLIGLIYVVELFLVASGRVLVGLDTPNRGIDFETLGTEMARLGAQTFIVTLLAHFVIAILGKALTRNLHIFKFARNARNVILVVLSLVAFTLMFSGLLYLFPSLEESILSLFDVLKQIFS